MRKKYSFLHTLLPLDMGVALAWRSKAPNLFRAFHRTLDLPHCHFVKFFSCSCCSCKNRAPPVDTFWFCPKLNTKILHDPWIFVMIWFMTLSRRQNLEAKLYTAWPNDPPNQPLGPAESLIKIFFLKKKKKFMDDTPSSALMLSYPPTNPWNPTFHDFIFLLLTLCLPWSTLLASK